MKFNCAQLPATSDDTRSLIGLNITADPWPPASNWVQHTGWPILHISIILKHRYGKDERIISWGCEFYRCPKTLSDLVCKAMELRFNLSAEAARDKFHNGFNLARFRARDKFRVRIT